MTVVPVGSVASADDLVGHDQVVKRRARRPVSLPPRFRWVQRFTPLLAAAAGFCRHSPGDRWLTDETYVKVNGHWR